MSVPVGEREEGKFSLLIKAESLARYTIEITANEKVFLPEYRKQVTDDIVELERRFSWAITASGTICKDRRCVTASAFFI